MKTNRFILFLCLILTAVALVPAAAAADGYASGSASRSGRVEIYAGRENAYFILSAHLGIAYVDQHDWRGNYTGCGEEGHYGFFRVEIAGVTSGFRSSYIWAPSATTHTTGIIRETNPKFTLPYKDNYVLDITPLSPDEASGYWRVDRLAGWSTPAGWSLDTMSNCSVGFQNGTSGSSSGSQGTGRSGSGNTHDMGKPNIGSRVYRSGDKNMTVFWVQTQMKATGRWYQGDNWDCTGNMGDHTMQEVRSFMQSRGYSGHSGNVDQTVINELAAYLGSRVQPVYVGGFYDGMNSIMSGGSSGSMNTIDSQSPSGSIRWVQTCLKYLGYYSGSADGVYGGGTERAVKAFQRAYGWVERDYVTLGVARAMLEAYHSAGGSISNLP